MSAVSPAPEPVAPAAPAPSAPPKRPSVLSRLLARLSRVERALLHDPLVQKDGKALLLALVTRVLVAAGASEGVVQLAKIVLHAVGI